ncbi:aldehyde dehydrogenase family protein [Georgenia sp. MJ170]|uniref:aldehyde dehydrogenase family protein n=1 Tax=Georgenia sunbinii TaxID=3117728 RepID=UPI002F26B708
MNFDNYIGGQFVPAAEHRANINPSDTADVVGMFPRSTAEELSAAVSAAKEAQPGWARTSPQARADVLERIAAAILAQAAELGDLLAREEGKTLREAVGEVTRAGHIFRFFSGEALRMAGSRQPSTREGVTVNITREPLGVVGIITPWNFPIAIPAWKTAPAIAYGNTVVLKPAELTPASTHALARIMHEAGLPAGVFNIVMGQGSVLGDALLDHPDLDAITFTGSENVGVQLAETAARRLMPAQLELGGKNPLVVAADADLDVAVRCAIDGSFYATGQRCTASSRLVVDDKVHDEFVERMLQRMSQLVVGDARDLGTEIGPVVDERQLETDLAYLDIAREGHGEVHGGERVERQTPGFYLTPALITGASNTDRTSREEIFGPVSSIIRVSDYEEAVAVANDTPFGLAAGICTTSLRLAEDFQQRAEAGMVMVNLPTAGVDPHVPFGGRKRSSFGPKEQGVAARDFYTQLKTSYVAP